MIIHGGRTYPAAHCVLDHKKGRVVRIFPIDPKGAHLLAYRACVLLVRSIELKCFPDAQVLTLATTSKE